MLKDVFGKFWFGNNGVKRVKVTNRDLQRNALRIQQAIERTQEKIEGIEEKMRAIDKSTPDGEKEYARLEVELKNSHELYGTLQGELGTEYSNIKKRHDGKFMIAPKDALMIGGLVFVGTFAIALERENPKALKLVSFLLKTLFPIHL